MIATNDGIYVDECDPLFRHPGNLQNLGCGQAVCGPHPNRLLSGDHLVISSAEDYPDYREIKTEINAACRSVNA